ncbi:MAG: M4 family metallopeptidase [Sporichthyaceae bacterium]
MLAPTHRRLRRALGVAALGLALTAGVTPLAPATPDASADVAVATAPGARGPAPQTLLAELRSIGGGATTIRTEPSTGAVRFVGFPAGTAWRAPVGSAGTPTQTAHAFLARYSTVFGVRPGQLRPTTNHGAPAASPTVRFAQYHGAVPVTGAELVLALDSTGGITTVAGKLLPGPRLGTEAAVTPARARDLAVAAARREWSLPASSPVTAGAPELSIVDSGLAPRSGSSAPTLAWQVPVARAGAGEPQAAFVFLDAGTGSRLAVLERVHAALDRRVCDNNNRRGFPATCLLDVDRTEGEAPSGISAIDDVYDHLGTADAFFRTRFGRDGLNGAGQPYRAVVRYCQPFATSRCPYQNAYWDGIDTLVFGSGYAADDVVFHELVHGITQSMSRLFYLDQSGAINESLSDIFAEFIDLLDPATDAADDANPSLRWLLGERLEDGAIRSLASPTDFDQPDSMLSAAYLSVPAGIRCSVANDYCGVHVNSGVGNKAAYLIAAGGEFQGRSVTGIGIPKAAAIFYRAAGLLGPLSRYHDLADALVQSCANLIGTAPLGADSPVSAADCLEVSDAVAATAMDYEASATDKPNLAPRARNRAVSAQKGIARLNVLRGAIDPDGDAVTFGTATNGTKGKVRCTAAGVCTYRAKPAARGTDRFTYTVRDGRGGVDTGTVAVKLSTRQARADAGELDDEGRAIKDRGASNDRGDGGELDDEGRAFNDRSAATGTRRASPGPADLVGISRTGAVRYAEGSALRTGDLRVRRSGGKIRAITGTGTFGPGLRVSFDLKVRDELAFGEIVVRHPRSGFVDRIPVQGDRIFAQGRKITGDVRWRLNGKAIPRQRMVFTVRDRRR